MLNVQLYKKRVIALLLGAAWLLCNSTLAFAQNTVTGRVTDKAGEPLVGVNVLEKGTNNGTVTSPDGLFSLNVAQGKVLEFSFVGYETIEKAV